MSSDPIRESSAKELVNYFATIPPLQKKALFENSYLNRRVRWKGKVTSISEYDDRSYTVFVWDLDNQDALTGLSLAKAWQGKVEQLRKGDRVDYEGVIRRFDYWMSFAIEVENLSLQPAETPSPSPAEKSKPKDRQHQPARNQP